MQIKPRILSARTIDQKEWVDNTINIYEFCSFSKDDRLPEFIREQLTSICRHLNKFDVFIGARLFFNRKKFDVIISANAEQAITFSFLSLFNRKKRNLHILEEIYLQEPVGFKQKIRPFVYKLFLRNVDYMRVSSKSEIDNYSKALNLDKKRFWFLPYPAPVMNPGIVDSEEDYILSAGKQFRDYSTLIKAIKGTGRKLIIVSDRKSMKNVKICDEVTVMFNISKQKYLDLLFKSKFIVVPLSNDFCSCGQFAFLEGMSYGKPAIVAKVAGSNDYIVDGRSGLFYSKGDPEDLREKILLLDENKELRDKIAREALLAIKNKFSRDVFVAQHFQFIKDRWHELSNR